MKSDKYNREIKAFNQNFTEISYIKRKNYTITKNKIVMNKVFFNKLNSSNSDFIACLAHRNNSVVCMKREVILV